MFTDPVEMLSEPEFVEKVLLDATAVDQRRRDDGTELRPNTPSTTGL